MIRKYSPVVVSLLLWILLVSSCVEWHDGPGPEGQPLPLGPHPMDSPTPTYTPTYTPTSTPTSTPTPAATPEAVGQMKQVQE